MKRNQLSMIKVHSSLTMESVRLEDYNVLNLLVRPALFLLPIHFSILNFFSPYLQPSVSDILQLFKCALELICGPMDRIIHQLKNAMSHVESFIQFLLTFSDTKHTTRRMECVVNSKELLSTTQNREQDLNFPV